MSTPDPPPQGGSYVVDPATGERRRVAWTAEAAVPDDPHPVAEKVAEKPAKAKKGSPTDG